MYNYQATKEAVISDPQIQQPHRQWDCGMHRGCHTQATHTQEGRGKTWKTKDPNSASKMNIRKATIHRMGLTGETFEGKNGRTNVQAPHQKQCKRAESGRKKQVAKMLYLVKI